MDASDNETRGKTFEDLKPMLRPAGIISGVMEVKPGRCTHCGLCIKNCPFKCLEMDENKVPKMREECICFSCFNCMIACPEDAVSSVRTFEVSGGFFDTQFPPFRMPLDPKDGEGNPAVWTGVERIIMERRSVRNFKKDPVPEPLIRRVLEAGRFAPSSGNHQPWKFAVVTDPVFLDQLEDACQAVWAAAHPGFLSDNRVMNMVDTVPTGVFDPRVQYGMGCVARKELPVFFGAPVVIFLGTNDRMVNCEIAAGICGQNMNLAAVALGLGFCWSGFGSAVNFIPELKSRLGYDDPWRIQIALCMGYPAFKQRGLVARHFRPVTWFRPGAEGPEIEEQVEITMGRRECAK
jgi:nitroreductase/NAD-dependent dihydropyrimidine dehydrogenase PreA subunit